MDCCVWMYHYIRPFHSREFPFLNTLTTDDFECQLDYLLKRGPILKLKEFEYYRISKKGFPPNCSILTFDDGLANHYDFVFPILKRKGIQGLFLFSSQPILEKKATTVHRIHALYGKLGYSWLQQTFQNKWNTKFGNGYEIHFHDVQAISEYPYDTEELAKFKYAMNAKLPLHLVDEIMLDIFNENFIEKEFIDEFYLNENQIKEMSKSGMKFGLHGHSHKLFSSLSIDEFKKETDLAINVYKNILEHNPHYITYPYGFKTSITKSQQDYLKVKGLKFGFYAEIIDEEKDNLSMSRIDCLELTKIMEHEKNH